MRSRFGWLSLAICIAAATACGGRNLELAPTGAESGSGGSSSQSSAATTATQSAAAAGDAVTAVGAGAADAASTATAVAVGSGGNGSSGDGGGTSSSGGGSDGSGGNSGSSSNNGAGGGFDPVQCFGCVAQRCPEVLMCVQDPRCSQGLACVAQECIAGGNADPVCLAGCYENPADALEAVQMISCVLGGCGAECAGLLGALPGG